MNSGYGRGQPYVQGGMYRMGVAPVQTPYGGGMGYLPQQQVIWSQTQPQARVINPNEEQQRWAKEQQLMAEERQKQQKQRLLMQQKNKLKNFTTTQKDASADRMIENMFGKVDPVVVKQKQEDNFGDFVSVSSPTIKMENQTEMIKVPEEIPNDKQSKHNIDNMLLQYSDLSTVSNIKPFSKPAVKDVKEVPFPPQKCDLAKELGSIACKLNALDDIKTDLKDMKSKLLSDEALQQQISVFKSENLALWNRVSDLECKVSAQSSITYNSSQKARNWSQCTDLDGVFDQNQVRISTNSNNSTPAWLRDPATLPPIYHQLLVLVGGSSGTVDAHRVSALLAASGLGKEALATIWRTVTTTQSAMSPVGFYVALALVAAVQSGGSPGDVNILRQMKQAPIPSLSQAHLAHNLAVVSQKLNSGTINVEQQSTPPTSDCNLTGGDVARHSSLQANDAGNTDENDFDDFQSAPLPSITPTHFPLSSSSSVLVSQPSSSSFITSEAPQLSSSSLFITSSAPQIPSSISFSTSSAAQLSSSSSYITSPSSQLSSSSSFVISAATQPSSTTTPPISSSSIVTCASSHVSSSFIAASTPQLPSTTSPFVDSEFSNFHSHKQSNDQLAAEPQPTSNTCVGSRLANYQQESPKISLNNQKKKKEVVDEESDFGDFQACDTSGFDKYSAFQESGTREDNLPKQVQSSATTKSSILRSLETIKDSLKAKDTPGEKSSTETSVVDKYDVFRNLECGGSSILDSPEPVLSSNIVNNIDDDFGDFTAALPVKDDFAGFECASKPSDVFVADFSNCDTAPSEEWTKSVAITNNPLSADFSDFMSSDQRQTIPSIVEYSETFGEFASADTQSLGCNDDFGDFVSPVDGLSLNNHVQKVVDRETTSLESQSVSSLELGVISRHGSVPSLNLSELQTEQKDGSPTLVASSASKEGSPVLLEEKKIEDRYSSFRGHFTEEKTNGPFTEWSRCVESSTQLMEQVSNLLAVAPNVQTEVLSTRECVDCLSNLTEVWGVVCRVKAASNKTGSTESRLQLALQEAEFSWNKIKPLLEMCSEISENMYCENTWDSEECSGGCGVCLLSTEGVDCVTYGGREYHTACANLWLNCVNPCLPALSQITLL